MQVDSFAPALSAFGLPIYVAPLPAGSIQRVCHDTLDFIQVPGYPSAIETRSLPTLTRSYPRRFTFYVVWPAAPFARLTHSRRNVVQRQSWLISLTHDLPSSLALSGLPVHVAASQHAPFSLGLMNVSLIF